MPETNTEKDSMYVIPVITAVEWTTKWRENHKIKAFTVDVAELNDIINELSGIFPESPIEKIRLYFGKKDDDKEALVLVGVDKQGKDIVEYVDENGDVQSGTYDFTHPCPSTCDTTSVLYGPQS